MPNGRTHLITGVDKLLKFINLHEETSITLAANHLNVPRDIVEHWSETLEDQGLIMTNLTIKDKYLMSLEFHKIKAGHVRTFIQNMKALGSSTAIPQEAILIKKEKEINKRLSLMDKKLKYLKDYKAVKQKADESIKELTKIQKESIVLRGKIEDERLKLKFESNEFLREQNEFYVRISLLSKKMLNYYLKKSALSDSEKELYTMFNMFKKKVPNVKKERKVLARKKSVMSKKDVVFLSKLQYIDDRIKPNMTVKKKVRVVAN